MSSITDYMYNAAVKSAGDVAFTYAACTTFARKSLGTLNILGYAAKEAIARRCREVAASNICPYLKSVLGNNFIGNTVEYAANGFILGSDLKLAKAVIQSRIIPQPKNEAENEPPSISSRLKKVATIVGVTALNAGAMYLASKVFETSSPTISQHFGSKIIDLNNSMIRMQLAQTLVLVFFEPEINRLMKEAFTSGNHEQAQEPTQSKVAPSMPNSVHLVRAQSSPHFLRR